MRLPFINRRAVALILILLTGSLIWSGAASRAQVKRLPKPSGHVNDFADVLDRETKSRLETLLENLKQRTGIDFVIATVTSAGAEDLYDYSLRVANEWNVGSMISTSKSILLLIAADNGKFFTQATRSARASLPDGLIGEMGLRMRPKLESSGYSLGLLTGIETFVTGLSERYNFTLADLDPQSRDQLARRQRPRVVGTPSTEVVESPATTPTPQPQESPAAAPTPSASLQTLPAPTPTPQPSESPITQAVNTTAASPTPQPSESPVTTPAEQIPSNATSQPQTRESRILRPIASPTEQVTASPTPTPAIELLPTPTPEASVTTPTAAASRTRVIALPSPDTAPVKTTTPKAEASPELAMDTNSTRTRSTRPSDRKTTTVPPANPEDEKEEVELTLTKPASERIELLKAFIAAHPQSVALPRAYELIVAARAMLGDQKLQAGDVDGGLEQFRLAISEAPTDMSDALFTEVIARIPMNLFLRSQRAAATDAARQAEALTKLNSTRLLALAEFYLTIEDAGEANRIAELAVQNAPDSAAVHQALGAARHIALRLDEAESEYARALAIDPKSAVARIALADLKRAGGKADSALTLYREQLQAESNSKSARAGLVLSLLELAKKDEAEQELKNALQDKDQARNLPLLVGAAYWFVAHSDPTRGLDLAQKAVDIEPRYSWAQIALARALMANKRPLEAERALRFARQYSRFPTLNYELANVLASMGLYDEAVQELVRSFSFADGQIETKLAGRNAIRSSSFIELLAPERRAAIFQAASVETESNARMMRALLAFTATIDRPSLRNEEVLAIAQEFVAGDDDMRTYRLVYVAGKFVRKGVALSSVADLMEKATTGVEAALSVPAATVAVQPEELSDIRARALVQGGTPDVPDAPRSALSGLLRGRIEDLAGLSLFSLNKLDDAVTHLRRAVSVSPEGTPLWRSAMWHLGSALEAHGKNDQALLYYIKSYVTGTPDAARRAVIENVYKKVNGSLEGLDEKIGPSFATANAPTPSPTP